MVNNELNFIKLITMNFAINGEIIAVDYKKNGLINQSYLVETTLNKYLIQKINHYVFKEPDKVMANIEAITNYLQDHHHITLKLIPLKDNHKQVYYYDESDYYRCYEYIDLSYSVDKINNNQQAYDFGKIIGLFQKNLKDFNYQQLDYTIPDFHNTGKRIADLQETLKVLIKIDPDNIRLKQVVNELFYIRQYEDDCLIIQNNFDKGLLPLRVVHNDTKMNNILINKTNDKPICLVDLDTVMPGISLFDYGDAVRVGCSTCSEDENDLNKIDIDLEYFEQFTKGYLFEMNKYLNKYEKQLLYNAIKTITLECAIRFLTDYLNNDLYFKVKYPNHNLVRTKTQIQLHRKLVEYEEIMKKIIKENL